MKPEDLHVDDRVRYVGPEEQWQGVVGVVKRKSSSERIACVDTALPNGDRGYFYCDAGDLEPWQPRVGETVRHLATGVVGVVESTHRHNAFVRDDNLAKWVGFDELEPAASQGSAQEQYLASQLLREAKDNIDYCRGRTATFDVLDKLEPVPTVQHLTYKRQAVVLGDGNPGIGPGERKWPFALAQYGMEWIPASDERMDHDPLEDGPGLAVRNDLQPPCRPERWREKTTTWGPYAEWDNLPDA